MGTTAALVAAVKDPEVRTIRVRGVLEDVPPFELDRGRRLIGEASGGSGLRFHDGSDGLRLAGDNVVRNLRLQVEPQHRAIHTDTAQPGFGRIELTGLRIDGQVQLIAADAARSGDVRVSDVDIEFADTTASETVHGYGVVAVRQGAFTLWNRQLDDSSVVTAHVEGLRVGRPDAPVHGAGIVISGAGDPTGRMDPARPPVGRIRLERLETAEVHTDGCIEPGTADVIAGGVLVLYGVDAEDVRLRRRVTTHGPNDMVMDNWGDVARWRVEAPLMSLGPSAIGVVNFGVIEELTVAAPIRTYGTGARGLNIFLGRLGDVDLKSVETHGDAGVGVQIGRPVGSLTVREGITTHGGTGPTLVSGQIVQLPAMALSVLAGGDIGELRLGGPLRTSSERPDRPSALQVAGHVGRLTLA